MRSTVALQHQLREMQTTGTVKTDIYLLQILTPIVDLSPLVLTKQTPQLDFLSR